MNCNKTFDMQVIVYVLFYIIDYVFSQIIFSFQVILINKLVFQSVDDGENNRNKQRHQL
jgi:flagellar biosynthesis protein FliP